MYAENTKNETSLRKLSKIFFEFFLVVLIITVFALLVHDRWVKYLNVYHTVLELICVFMALAVFASVWYNYQRSSFSTGVLGFGFLIVAVFDALHSYYHLRLDITSTSHFDLSTWYWILGRLIAAVIVFVSSYDVKIKINKVIPLAGSLFLIVGTSLLLTSGHNFLPILLTNKGVTGLKVLLEYVVIIIFSLSLYRIRNKVKEKDSVTYYYMFLSLLIMIPAELCFTLYSSIQSVTWTTGHMLKIISYYYLFRGVFVNTITYPYKELEDKHKQLEEAHEELNYVNNTMNDVLDALPIAVLKYSKKAKVKYVNKKFEELFECNRNELYGITEEEFLREYKRLETVEESLFNKVMNSKNGQVTVLRSLKKKDGQQINLFVNANKITNGALLLIRDAREEQELKNLHLQTETILNSVTNAIVMIDNNKKIVLCNNAFEELVGMSKKDIIGMDIDKYNELIGFEFKEMPDQVLGGQVDKQMYETSLIAMNGSKKELYTYVGKIENTDGEIIGAISVSTDITEMKQEQLKIRQQEKLALLGQLGAGIVHETRNYLTTIKGRCQLIGLTAKDEDTKGYAAKINQDVNEVNRIISEFLFLSKPRELEFQEVSMYDIFRSIENLVESSSLIKGTSVEMEVSKEERYLMCDEVQIKQVILNICKNAVEAMSDVNNPKLKLETGYNEASNEAFVKISDNGKGMSEEELKKIGTLFFTTKRTGTGLGLNVCYQIIKDHKGKIEVESQLGIGTTFTITLPCIEDEEDYEEVC